MADDFVRVNIEVEKGSMTPEEVQKVLDRINKELADPNSDASKEASKWDVSVRSVAVDLDAPFVLESFLLGLAVKFAGGAATAGGALFFNKVIKPRIDGVRADGVGEVKEVKESPSAQTGGGSP